MIVSLGVYVFWEDKVVVEKGDGDDDREKAVGLPNSPLNS